jgi:4-hydroxy-tetrahydrodipicolinate synthase
LARDCETVVSIKEAGGSSDRVNKLVQAVPETFTVVSGDDPLTVPFISVGAVGVVSVAANLIPDVVARLVKAALNGSFGEALEIQKRYYPLLSALMTLDTNPIPIKSALALCGQCTAEFRLPLVGLTGEKTEELRAVLSEFELL